VWPDRFLGAGHYHLQYKHPCAGANTAGDNALHLKSGLAT